MITYKEWMSYTSQSGRRSPKLKVLDAALQEHETRPTSQNWLDLCTALSEWADFKGLGSDGRIRTNRSVGTVNRLINDVFQEVDRVYGPWLLHDMQIAQQLCDPFLKKRVVGQGLSNSDEDREKYKVGAGQSAVAMIAAIADTPRGGEEGRFGLNLKPSEIAKRGGATAMYDNLDFWYRKGERESGGAVNSGLWCDASAALIVYELARNPSFKSRLDVVSQGDPKHFGHWYVVANRRFNDPLQYPNYFGESDGRFNFTIDIWGAINDPTHKSSVIYPARPIYNCSHGTAAAYDHNNIQIRCTIDRKLM